MSDNEKSDIDYKNAKSFFDKGFYDDALLILKEDKAIKTKDINILLLLAAIYRKKGTNDKALFYYNKALIINPNLSDIYLNIGNIYSDIEEFDKAYKYFMKALSIDKNNIAVLNNLSLLLKDLRQFDRAITNFKKILNLDPNNLEALINLGICYQIQGMSEKAIKYLEMALKIDPDNVTLLNVLGNNKMAIGDYEDAINIFNKGKFIANEKNLNEKNSEDLKNIRKNLATALFDTGRIKKGIKEKSKSSGYIKLNIDQSISSVPKVNSINNNFIGDWVMEDKKICHEMIEFFNKKKNRQQVGELGGGYNKNKKDSLDLSIDPIEFKNPDFQFFKNYFRFLQNCLTNYCEQWPFLNKLDDMYIGTFNIQKYFKGGHFKWPHAERMEMYSCNRVFAWMTYLNDIEKGGETVFTHYNVKFSPNVGRTLIWPAEWTHAHYGDEVGIGEKYIITGWMEIHK